MAISSVNSTASAASQQLLTDQARQSEQARQASQAREAPEASQDNESAESSPPQPVVNTQGQVTGTIVNTIV
jgi:hypothetical protein